jgi:trans-aconitate methyltransferase
MPEITSTFTASSGDSYELMMGRWSRLLAEPFLEFAGLTDDSPILDAGCGTGALSAELLRRTKVAEIVGLDYSKDYVDFAEATIQDPRIAFETGDVTALRYEDATFNQIFTHLVLQFVPDSSAAIAELSRVLKPGGSMAATVWDARGGFVFYRLFLDTAAMIDPAADELRGKLLTRPLMRPGELAAAWQSAGLTDVRSGELTIRMNFSEFDDYWAPMDGKDGPLPNYLRTTEPDLRAKIKEAVRRAFLDGDPDGPRSYTATSWVVSGMKPNSA